MNTLTQLTQLSLLVGAGLPLLIAVLNRCDWPSRTKSLVAFAACVVASGLAAVVAGELTAENWGTALVLVFGASHATYSALYKPTGVADAVETATTRSHSVTGAPGASETVSEGKGPGADGEGLSEPYSADTGVDADGLELLNRRVLSRAAGLPEAIPGRPE